MTSAVDSDMRPGSDVEQAALLTVEALQATAVERGRQTFPLQGVALAVPRNRIVGLVGESGSGKSLTASAILGMLPAGVTAVSGTIRFEDQDLLTRSERQLRRIRGVEISAVFQDAKGSLNPVIQVGKQISEILRVHEGISRRAAWAQSVELLDGLGIRNAPQRAHDYPHQFSGGMAQRVALARALACSPKLLIADEPTTGLDATIQAEVLELMVDRIRSRSASLLLISHDIDVIAATCDDAVVMYGGVVLEAGPTALILDSPLSPYTRALIECFVTAEPGPMRAIAGTAPTTTAAHEGCPFRDRCDLAAALCTESVPALRKKDGRMVACHLA